MMQFSKPDATHTASLRFLGKAWKPADWVL